MTKKTWIKYLCSALLIGTAPVMTYAEVMPLGQVVEKQVFQVEATIPNEITLREESAYISPINIEVEVLSYFGEARNGYMHQGIDLRIPIGTPIYAIADATVIKAAPDSKGVEAGGGHIIMLDHENGVQTWYMHLDAYAVSLGDKVKQGQIIGFSGSSGDSTTPHLHFEYRINGVPIVPDFIVGVSELTAEKIAEETVKSLITLDEPFVVVQS